MADQSRDIALALHGPEGLQEGGGAPEPERRVFVFRRLEPVEYRLCASSEAEAFAILEDKGGAAAFSRRAVPEVESVATGGEFELVEVVL